MNDVLLFFTSDRKVVFGTDRYAVLSWFIVQALVGLRNKLL